jgi:hypothetical protein
MFDHKDRDQRIGETIDFIDNYSTPDDLENLVAVLKTWKDGTRFANERKRVSDAMHQGPFGSENERMLRRASILLRTAVLRHDSSKTEREVNGIGAAALGTYFEGLLRQCVNHTQVVPPYLEVLRASDAATRGRDKLKSKTAQLAKDLGSTEGGWLTTLENNLAKMSKSQKKLYQDWKAQVARHDQLKQDRAAARKYLYLPVPSDINPAMKGGRAKFGQEMTVVERGAGGLGGLRGAASCSSWATATSGSAPARTTSTWGPSGWRLRSTWTGCRRRPASPFGSTSMSAGWRRTRGGPGAASASASRMPAAWRGPWPSAALRSTTWSASPVR